MRYFLLIVLAGAFFSSCTNPEKLILGKWTFDHIEVEPNNSEQNALADLGLAMNSILEQQYKDMYMEFYSTGECVIYEDWMSHGTKRPYYISSDKKYIVTETEDVGEERIEIVRIDDKELAILRGGITLVFIRQ